LEILKRSFPEHNFFSEEAGQTQNQSEYLWIIDPLDGTTNFIHGFPHVGISIALLKNKQPILGVILDPLHNELFTAETGQGAYLNGIKISPSTTDSLEKTVTIMTRGATTESIKRHADLYQTIITNTHSTRITGSVALGLAYLACGRFDASINNDCKFYDCVAGNLISHEAGAILTTFRNQPWKGDSQGSTDILAANKHMHNQILNLIKEK